VHASFVDYLEKLYRFDVSRQMEVLLWTVCMRVCVFSRPY